MIRWEALIRPKEFGGLGFMDVRVMNICLLSKWIDKLERDDSGLCCSILKKKYLGQKSIFQIKNKKGSQFWRSLLEMRQWYERGRVVEVVSGQQTRFWQDSWLRECPLRIMFHSLYQICSNPDIEVAKIYVDGQWDIQFRRQLSEDQIEDWWRLRALLEGVVLSSGRDRVYWALESSNKYYAKSLYKNLTTGGVRDMRMLAIWSCDIPLKVKIFMWMVAHDRIQSAIQLKKKKWAGPAECSASDKTETTDHILFQCHIAVFLWYFVRNVFGWQKSPTSCEDFLVEFVDNRRGKLQKTSLFICAGALLDYLEDS